MSAVETDHKTIETKWGDMLPLVRRVKKFVEARISKAVIHQETVSPDILAAEFGFTNKESGKPEVVLAENTAVELGHPSVPSTSILLLTRDTASVDSGTITLIGPDIPDTPDGAKLPFAQVVMLEIEAGAEPDPFELGNLQYLMHRLPGYMTRSVPGRLWVRVSREAKTAGISLHTAGSALVETFSSDTSGISGAEILFVTSSGTDVEELKSVSAEAEILMGKHRKLSLAPDGELECEDLDCDTCEEKPVCDDLRDVVIKRRRLKNERG